MAPRPCPPPTNLEVYAMNEGWKEFWMAVIGGLVYGLLIFPLLIR